MLKLVGDESRFKILSLLRINPLFVSDLVTKTGLEQSLISHHLRYLKNGGLVTSKRQGKWVLYSLTAKGREAIINQPSLPILKLIKDESRSKLLSVLKRGPYCVSELITKTGLEQSLISHHLKNLKEGGLVSFLRYGKCHYYEI